MLPSLSRSLDLALTQHEQQVPPTYSYNPTSIAYVRHLLDLAGLPLELADQILDLESVTTFGSLFSSRFEVVSSSRHDTKEILLALTDAVLGPGRRVVFAINACSDGYYLPSSPLRREPGSWFEAVILRPRPNKNTKSSFPLATSVSAPARSGPIQRQPPKTSCFCSYEVRIASGVRPIIQHFFDDEYPKIKAQVSVWDIHDPGLDAAKREWLCF